MTASLPAQPPASIPDYLAKLDKLRAALLVPGISAAQRARTASTIARMEADLKQNEIERKARDNAARDDPVLGRFNRAKAANAERAKRVTREDKDLMRYELGKHR